MELEQMASGNDVESQLAAMKAELSGGSSDGPKELGQGEAAAQDPAQQQGQARPHGEEESS